jgi:integrase
MKPIWPPKSLPRNFPCTVAERGYVARIKGKLTWICGKKEPREALAIYHQKQAAANSARAVVAAPQPVQPGAVDLHYILARWLVDRRADAERGELSGGAYYQYRLSADRIDAIAGHLVCDQVSPDTTKLVYDALAKAHGLDFAKRAIGHLRTACRHAEESGWCLPVRLGERVVAKLIERPKASMQWRLYTPRQVRDILAAADEWVKQAGPKHQHSRTQLRAAIYLALNGGMGAKECADLERSVVDLEGKRLDFSRGKTSARHIVPLWPETIAALKPVLAQRPGDSLVFRTRHGNPWCWERPVHKKGKLHHVKKLDNFGERFNELVEPLGLKIDGQSFYKLKHLHCTVADMAGDPHATFALAGHELPGAKGHYVKIDEGRIRKVVEFVRHHLLLSPEADRPSVPGSDCGHSPTPHPGSAEHRPPARAGETSGESTE